MKKYMPYLYTFFGDLLWNLMLIVFGAALYITSAATVGLVLPAYLDTSLLVTLSLVVTLLQHISRGIENYYASKRNKNADPAISVSDHPRSQ